MKLTFKDIEEKGLLQLEITAKGITAHASEPFKGDNPIIKLFDVYNDLLNIYPMPENKDDFKTSVNLSKSEPSCAGVSILAGLSSSNSIGK